MPLPRFDHLDAEQKARILSAAQAEFALHGYEEASLARIAAAAGISKGTLYYYFSDRDDLYATVVLRLVQHVAGAEVVGAFAPKRSEEFWPALEALFDAGFDLARRYPEEVRALRTFQVSLRRNPRPAFEPIVALMTAQIRGIVDTGRALGAVRTDVAAEVLVELLLAADEVLDRSLSDAMKDARALERHAALALDTFRRLMEPRAGSASKKKGARR